MNLNQAKMSIDNGHGGEVKITTKTKRNLLTANTMKSSSKKKMPLPGGRIGRAAA